MNLDAGQPGARLLDERGPIAALVFEDEDRALRIALLADREALVELGDLVVGQTEHALELGLDRALQAAGIA